MDATSLVVGFALGCLGSAAALAVLIIAGWMASSRNMEE